jgi:hypothetical protein
MVYSSWGDQTVQSNSQDSANNSGAETSQPSGDAITAPEERYFNLLISALRVCAHYRPKFGKTITQGFSLSEFQALYAADPFYHWIGLDSPLVYAAHKAAGGITSIYRQLGIGGEWIFRAVLQDTLHLSSEATAWSYTIPTEDGKSRILTLDGRIDLPMVADEAIRQRLRDWIERVMDSLFISDPTTRTTISGVIFEVRQGYKSKDAKRQNADIANATNAYLHHYVPVLVVLSGQIDQSLAQRYMAARWHLLTGVQQGTALQSTYAFCRDVLGYDLAHFFETYAPRIRVELEKILTLLLEA